MTLSSGSINQSQQALGSLASPVPTSPSPAGPGGNTIVPNPPQPSDWWKMLIAIGILSTGIWAVSTMWSEDAAKWLAFLLILGIITYYETHGNKQFSSMLNETLGSLK